MSFSIQNDGQIPALAAILGQRRQLATEIKKRLRESGCENPSVLRVDASVHATADQSGSSEFKIAYHTDLPPQPPFTINVLKGEAEQSSYVLNEGTMNIGRLGEVQDDLKRLIRRNHVVFRDVEQGVNSTVSRCHAHISFDLDSGWFRLYDDASTFGTRIHREGRIIELPRGPGGAWLRNGDEVHFGQARVSVEFSEC